MSTPELYDPELEEEDQGYSIPKILVAVLLLFLVGAGTYIFMQQRKIANTVRLLTEQKKQVDKELSEMIEMYNLAKDDNNNLSKELTDDRQRFIRFQDSIKKIKFLDKKGLEDYNNALQKLKETSKLNLENPTASRSNTYVLTKTPETDNTAATKPAISGTTTPTETHTVATTSSVTNTNPEQSTTTTPTTPSEEDKAEIVRSETPAIYPGCTGTTAQKTDCFKKKISGKIVDHFDQNVIESLNLSTGLYKINVAFTVDRFGNVTGVKARGPNAKAEQEAIKATKTFPKLSPARQNGVPVDVNFYIPLSIRVE